MNVGIQKRRDFWFLQCRVKLLVVKSKVRRHSARISSTRKKTRHRFRGDGEDHRITTNAHRNEWFFLILTFTTALEEACVTDRNVEKIKSKAHNLADYARLTQSCLHILVGSVGGSSSNHDAGDLAWQLFPNNVENCVPWEMIWRSNPRNTVWSHFIRYCFFIDTSRLYC